MNIYSITYSIAGRSFETLRRALVCALLAASGSVALADDTEIYFGTAGVGGVIPADSQPNVVFILDTSGSMNDPPGGTPPAYDPLEVYGSSPSTNVYVYTGTPPSLTQVWRNGAAGNGQVVIAQSSLTATCFTGLAALGVAATPYYATKAVYEDGGTPLDNHRELDIGTDMDPAEQVWCQADAGAYATDPAGSGTGDCSSWNSGNCNDNYVLVSANYHDYIQIYRSKRNLMVNTAKNLVDQFTGLNMAIMRFSNTSGDGGFVLRHITSTSTDANRTALKAALDTLPATGATPLSKTLWEAHRYFQGLSQDYGDNGGAATDTAAGNPYNSPIIGECQKNHIVYLTDGRPTVDTERNANIYIPALIGSACSVEVFGGNGDCLDDLAGYMVNKDFNTSLSGTQNVTTHVIGFGLGADPTALAYLDKTAAAGGSGRAYQVDTADQLVAAFNNIVAGIVDTSASFAAPAVQSGSYNRLQGSNALFYGMFKPYNAPRWTGNVKKYGLGVDENKQIIDVLDKDSLNAIDPSTGFFKTTATSYWSASVDGADTERGGAASNLDNPTNRPFLTDLGSGPVSVDVSNTAITTAMLGAADDVERDAILEWARGFVAGSTASNYFMADVLHSRPLLLQYEPKALGAPEIVVAGSNLGILHGIDTSNGKERFAFIPKELLPKLTTYYRNSGDHFARTYGLDGPLTLWHKLDRSLPMVVTDHAYLYTGLRRGGKTLYAFNLTNPDKPLLMWQINGGPGGTPGFERMGETWAEPVRTRVMIEGDIVARDVLFFGGGYDPQYDTSTLASPGTSPKMGNAIYMVDAITGKLLWSVSGPGGGGMVANTNMVHSFVSEINLWDRDGDYKADFFFTIDVGGQIWRFDLTKKPIMPYGADFLAGGGVIASLNGSTTTTFRKFYTDLNIELIESASTYRFSINVGSGQREKPLETNIQNRIYTVFDKNVFQHPPGYNYNYVVSPSGIIQETDLVDATTWMPVDPIATYGWYRPMDASIGEKGISTGSTLGDLIVLTTYVPGASSACVAATGSNRLYVLNALTGQTALKDDKPFDVLALGGIAPEIVTAWVLVPVEVTYEVSPGVWETITQNTLVEVQVVGTEVFQLKDKLDKKWLIGANPNTIRNLRQNGMTVQYWREN